MRILFVTSSRIGDAVIASGALEHFRARYPQARITVACGTIAAPLFMRLPGLERIIAFEKRRFDLHWVDLWRQTAFRPWDIVLDTRGSGLSLFLPAKRRLMVRGGRRPGARWRQIAASLGIEPAPFPVVWTGAQERARALALLPPGSPIVGLGPSANWDGKIWPADRFIALYQALAAERLAGARVAVFAGPGEAERGRAAPVLAALPGAIDLVGRLALPEVAACMERLALFVGNDSGLMHVAAAAGAPTLGLFGRSRAEEYAPAGPRAAAAIAPGPAGEAPMAGLSVAAALEAAEHLLRARDVAA